MTNLIVFVVVAVIVGGAGAYIYKEKKKGVKCIGCPAGILDDLLGLFPGLFHGLFIAMVPLHHKELS